MSQGRHIFLSYRSTDAEFALKLAASLKNEGVNLWMDRLDIDPGDDWRKELGNALTGASAVIAILSPGYVASKYCQRELARADRLGHPVFPILLGAVAEHDWPLEIERYQYIDFSQWQDERAYTASLHRLVHILKERLAGNFHIVPTPHNRYRTNLAVELETRRGVVDYLERGSGAGGSSDEDTRPERRFARGWADSLHFVVVEHGLALNRTGQALPLPGYKTATRDIAGIVEQYPRFVLLGEPGSGKTTTLQQLALDAVRAQPSAMTRVPLPLLVHLADWDDRAELKDFIASQWPLESDPFKLMAEGDIVLYLDGLNEIGSQHSRKLSALRTWLASSIGPRRVIVTCRVRDYTGDVDLELPVVRMDALQPAHIRRFASRYLDDATSAAFVDQVLPGDDREERGKQALYDLARNAFSLSALLAVFRHQPGDTLPANRGTLLRQLTARMWLVKSADAALEGVTFAEVEAALSQLARAMIEDEAGVYVPYKVALQHLGSEALLEAAQHVHYLDVRLGKVRFSYQAQQEYFAAQALLHTPAEPTRPQLDERGMVIAGKWDGAMVMQCCLSDKPNQLALNIAKVNPFLAINCVASGAEISGSTLDSVTGKVLHFAGSPKKDVKVAIASVLAQIAPELALPMLVEAMRAGQWEIRSSATLALWELDARLLESLTQVIRDLDRVEDAALTAIRRLQDDALPTLVKLLRSEDRKIRRSAGWALGELRDQAAVPGLVQTLYDSDPMVAEEAARALSLLKDEAAIPWLVETLQHSNVRVRKAAARALGMTGEPALKPLLEAMRDGTEEMSCLVAEALSQIRLPVVTEILLDLTRATAAEVRCAAIEALDNRRDPPVVQRLIECLADETVVSGQKRICDVAARMLENVDTAEAKVALEGWKMTQNDRLPAIRARDGKSASTAKERLQHITRPKTGPLPPDPAQTPVSPPPSPTVSPPAASATPPPARTIKPLRQQSAPEASAATDTPSLTILESLLANIKRDTAWGERENAARALREYAGTLHGLKVPDVVKRLVQELNHPDWLVRWAATEALASVGDAQAAPALMAMVQDANWSVRVAVVRALLEVGESSATDVLLPLVGDKQNLVREAVAEALGVLRGPNAFSGVIALLQDSDAMVRLAAVTVLPRFTDAQVEPLAQAALQDENAHVRWAAAGALGKVGTAASVDALAWSLDDNDGPYWETDKIADRAAAALERIATPEALALVEMWRSRRAGSV